MMAATRREFTRRARAATSLRHRVLLLPLFVRVRFARGRAGSGDAQRAALSVILIALLSAIAHFAQS
jgi:hypothetical protein